MLFSWGHLTGLSPAGPARSKLPATPPKVETTAQSALTMSGEFDRATTFVPTDPLFASQWHNAGTPAVNINITQAWDYYTGAGVKFGIYDDGIDIRHPDLAGAYDASLHVTVNGVFDNPTVYNAGDGHGTAVAGLIAARQGNGQGGTGGSFNATITGVDIFGAGGTSYIFGAMNAQDRFDITNHSWGWVNVFADNSLNAGWSTFFAGLADAAQNGRAGLGTIQMVAAGNDRASDDNTNTSNFTSSRFVNAIAAITDAGQIASYSNPGASLLVAAPSNGGTRGITTTDYTGSAGYSAGDYTSTFGGTSAATPIASSVVGLMLEANPRLGYRDVMEILAITARQMGNPAISGFADVLRPWQFNGASNWNNGGMHFSHDYGYGLIDAFAAVKLAQSWNLQQTFANELVVSRSNTAGGAVPDNTGASFSRTIDLTPASGAPINIEAIEVQINWSAAHIWVGDLVIELVSPSGMTSYLLDRSGGSADLTNWVFTTRAHLGELATGVWTVRITDRATGDTGTVSSITLRAYGSSDVSDTYYYTDEFATVAGASAARQTLADTDGGTDTINVAALSVGAVINLTAGQTNQIGAASFVIAAGSIIENVIGSWSADTIVGNDAANQLIGNAGNDAINGGLGDDQIWGGRGSDTIDGGGGTDYTYFDAAWDAISWTVTDVSVTFTFADQLLGPDTVSNVEYFIDSLGFQRSLAELAGSPPPPLPPLAPTITGFSTNSGSTADRVTNDSTPTLTITAEPDVDSVEVLLNGQVAGTATKDVGGNFTFTAAVALADGAQSFTARAIRAGVTSTASAALALTIDTAAASVLSLNPADNAVDVAPAANIVLTFSETVVAGTGNIVILANGTAWRTIAVTSPEVTVTGAQVTINPAVDMPAGTAMAVTIDSGALTDLAGNAFPGITNATVFNFSTAAGNVFTGTAAADTYGGTAGNDIINGLGGNDNLSGGAGDDVIDGGAGNDTMNGGTNGPAGDTVSYATATAAVTVSLASTGSQNTGGAGRDTLSGFENLVGSDFNDRLTGSSGANLINGGLGADTITGGQGVDTLAGGSGGDIFDFNAVSETGNDATTRDVITDFQQGQDRIDLSTIDAAPATRNSNDAFIFRGAIAAFGTSTSGEIRYAQENGNMTIIYGDTDGDSAAEFQIALNGLYTLTAADFVL